MLAAEAAAAHAKRERRRGIWRSELKNHETREVENIFVFTV
jgi:hypothetical protein